MSDRDIVVVIDGAKVPIVVRPIWKKLLEKNKNRSLSQLCLPNPGWSKLRIMPTTDEYVPNPAAARPTSMYKTD